MRRFLAKLIGLLLVGWEKLTAFLKKFSRRTYGTVAVILLCAILLLDVGYHFSQGFSASLETMSARVGTLGEELSFDVYLMREETPFSGNAEKTVYYVGDGEKVKKDMALAAIYSDTADDELLDSLKSATEAKRILESVSESRPEKVTETLSLRISGTTLAIEEALRTGNIQKANREKNTLSALMLSREAMSGLVDTEKAIASLAATISSLEKTIGQPQTILTAKDVGWFSYSVDGYEAVSELSPTAMSYEELSSLFEKKEASAAGVGKLITSHHINAVSFVSLDDLAYFSQGKQYTLTSEQGQFSLTLEKIVRNNDEGKAALIFSSTALTESLEIDRIATMSLTVEEYEGFKVPTSAYAEYKGVHGVYVLKGFVVEFREISVIYRKDSMMIAEPSPKDKSGKFKLLSENDNIIIKGEDLYDGKIVQGAS